MQKSIVPNVHKFVPTRAVWELTYACNMRCKHCGSSCGDPLPNEMSLDVALRLCDELADIGIQHITLSGGEPFLHPNWAAIARRLTDRNVKANVISNGWFVDDQLLDQAMAAGITNICLSVDGYGQTHDYIRRAGSYDKLVTALQLMQKRHISTACITSVNKKNLPELAKMKVDCVRLGVKRWQIQLAMPMGNLLLNQDLILEPQDIQAVMDFCYATMQEQQIVIHIGDNLGYCTDKYKAVVRYCNASYDPKNAGCNWGGCQAGKRILGIRADGNIYGCLAIRDDKYCAGNVTKKSLSEIWQDEQAFAWNRGLKKENLVGFCRKCQYGDTCLGGCSVHKLAFGGSFAVDNANCLYKIEIENLTADVASINTPSVLIEKADGYAEAKNFQAAEIYVAKALQFTPDDLKLLCLAGFVHYFLKNYALSLEFNERALVIDPASAYATRGKGLCLRKFGQEAEGMALMHLAVELADVNEFDDACYDLVIALVENGSYQEALTLLEVGRSRSVAFKCSSEKLYLMVSSLDKRQ